MAIQDADEDEIKMFMQRQLKAFQEDILNTAKDRNKLLKEKAALEVKVNNINENIEALNTQGKLLAGKIMDLEKKLGISKGDYK